MQQQQQQQEQKQLPRSLWGIAAGMALLLAGKDGTPSAAAERLEAATLMSGTFYCFGCKAKCCIACTVGCVLWIAFAVADTLLPFLVWLRAPCSCRGPCC